MKLLSVAAAVEIIVGLILAVSPSLVAQLLFGTNLTSAGIALGRIAGFGLFALGMACWPRDSIIDRQAVRGLLAYNLLATLFFFWLGIRGELVGLLIWPAAVLHGVFSVLLARALVAKTT